MRQANLAPAGWSGCSRRAASNRFLASALLPPVARIRSAYRANTSGFRPWLCEAVRAAASAPALSPERCKAEINSSETEALSGILSYELSQFSNRGRIIAGCDRCTRMRHSDLRVDPCRMTSAGATSVTPSRAGSAGYTCPIEINIEGNIPLRQPS